MAAPTLTSANCCLRKKNLEQELTLRISLKKLTILKVRAVQLPMFFYIFNYCKKISALTSIKIEYHSILVYLLIYKSTLENVTQNSQNKSLKNRAILSLFF